MKIPNFATKEELFTYLKENKDDLVYQKKSAVKYADAVGLGATIIADPFVEKSDTFNEKEVKIRAIINTTNVRDSHGDVHVKGIWNKTVKENKRMKHIQEHKMEFDKIIADKGDLEVSVKEFSWKDLGVDAEGKTEALVFDSTIKQERNGFMFRQYKEGNVDNHSVGMQYVKMELAMNSKADVDKEEKAVWDKHFPDVLNKEETESKGFFWAVSEAKAIEGSAVPIGSNTITPTLQPTKATVTQKEDAAQAHLESIYKFLKS